MAFLFSILLSVFNYVIGLFNNKFITFAAYASLIVISGIYDVIRIKGFIHKTFVCLVCGHNFTPKWYKLMLSTWRAPRKNRVYKEIDGETFEKLIYKCPECKNREFVAK